MSEKEEQKRVVNYAKSLGLFVYAIPAVKFTGRQGGFPVGYIKGMPDLHIPELRLYLEMKDKKAGKVKEHEENQINIADKLREKGQYVFRCEGFEHAKGIIDDFVCRKNEEIA